MASSSSLPGGMIGGRGDVESDPGRAGEDSREGEERWARNRRHGKKCGRARTSGRGIGGRATHPRHAGDGGDLQERLVGVQFDLANLFADSHPHLWTQRSATIRRDPRIDRRHSAEGRAGTRARGACVEEPIRAAARFTSRSRKRAVDEEKKARGTSLESAAYECARCQSDGHVARAPGGHATRVRGKTLNPRATSSRGADGEMTGKLVCYDRSREDLTFK